MFSAGSPWADALYVAAGDEMQCSQTLQEAVTRLREQTYTAAVIDQFLLATEPDESDRMIEHLGTAFPRRCELRRHGNGSSGARGAVRSAPPQARVGAARRAVAQQMHHEMCETLTAMLLL
jgi:hypothetical protein